MSGSNYGALAELVCVREKVAAAKPVELTFEQAATVPHSAVLAWQGLTRKRPIRPGQSVLINGAGGCVGPWAVQLAKSFGAKVTAVDTTAKLDWLRSIGADQVVDHTREDVTRGGRRFDHILDIAAHGTVLRYRRALTTDGCYTLIARSLTGFVVTFVLGSAITMTSRKRMNNFLSSPSERSDLDSLAGLLATEKIVPHIDSRCDLDGVPDGLRRLAAGDARGKIVVTLP